MNAQERIMRDLERTDVDPYPKTQQLARTGKRYVRKVGSPKAWAAIIAEKIDGQPCRICNRRVRCDAAHLVGRAQGGHDVADNIVPLCRPDHMAFDQRKPDALRRVAESLTDSEYAWLIQTFGEAIMERRFGVTHQGGWP